MATIRPAGPADAKAIAFIHVETWRSTYAGVLPDAYLTSLSVADRTAFWRGILSRRDQGMTVVVEDQEAGVVGFGNAGTARADGLPADSDWNGEIYTLYLLPDWHGQGLGRQLMEALFDCLRLARLRRVILWVLEANPTRFFYEAMGGRLIARRSEPFAGVLLDELAYGWTLDPAPR
ncbi:MAG: GNAT family N-acetyltransferase [Pseudomonadota bacterium]